MKLSDLQKTLSNHTDLALQIRLPDGTIIPPHFHVTEIGYVTKDFVDCGGTRRSTAACVLQTLVANDVEHRLRTSKFAKIVAMAEQVVPDNSASVEVEYDTGTISYFALDEVNATDDTLTLVLTAKHTACLAPEKCNLDILPTPSLALDPSCDPAGDC